MANPMGHLGLRTMNDALGRLAVLIPCYNEETTIAAVVGAFRSELPDARVYVYDNNSSDGTAAAARDAGAIVRREPFQGKGNVVRRMFADVEADTYVLIDGDGTYDVASIGNLLDAFGAAGADMVVGGRADTAPGAYRPGHRAGNRLLTSLVGWIFGRQFDDMLSGYRVFSRRFVKSFPAMSQGFEIEVELTIHCLELRMIALEVETPYHARPEGSVSKLSTFGDGWRILRTIAELFREERPMPFFSILFALFAVTSIGLSIPVIFEYMETGLVPRFPTAILSTGLMVLAFLSLACGLILDTVTRGRREMKRLRYLSVPARPGSAPDTGNLAGEPDTMTENAQ